MERELEFLREQVGFLERLLQDARMEIASLTGRVSDLERRPLVVLPPEAEDRAAAVGKGSFAVESRGHITGALWMDDPMQEYATEWQLPRLRGRHA